MAQTPKRYLSLKTGKIVKSKTAHSRAEILDYSKIKIGDRVRILIADDSAYSLKRYDDIQNRAIYGLNLDSGLEVIGLGKSWSHTPNSNQETKRRIKHVTQISFSIFCGFGPVRRVHDGESASGSG